jgi:hypothetical protein
MKVQLLSAVQTEIFIASIKSRRIQQGIIDVFLIIISFYIKFNKKIKVLTYKKSIYKY